MNINKNKNMTDTKFMNALNRLEFQYRHWDLNAQRVATAVCDPLHYNHCIHLSLINSLTLRAIKGAN